MDYRRREILTRISLPISPLNLNIQPKEKTLHQPDIVLYFSKSKWLYIDNSTTRVFYAPVAQWIEQWFPVPCAGVRFPSGVLHGTMIKAELLLFTAA